jgi:molecular chaperone GrpE
MVASQFRATLEKQGVQTISSIDQTFNPEIHEAVAQQPSDKSSGIIIQEHQKGYLLHGRLLRPSRVVVSSGAANH